MWQQGVHGQVPVHSQCLSYLGKHARTSSTRTTMTLARKMFKLTVDWHLGNPVWTARGPENTWYGIQSWWQLWKRCVQLSRISLTIYKTGKMLIQAEGNKHSLSSHFVDNHLEALYTQVYNKKKLQKNLTSKTPVTKQTGGGRRTISRVHKCL